MKANDMLNKIKTIIGGIELTEEVREVELAEMKLENGTVIEAEEFKKDEAVFIKSEDERIAMPVGEYSLEDNRLLIIQEEGIIADMRDVSEKEKQTEEDMQEDIKEEMAEEAAVYDWKGMEKRIKNLEDAIADLKADKMDSPEDVKEEASAELSEEKTEEVKSELSKEEIKENVDVELSAEVAEPVKHNPEASNESKFTLNKTNYPKTLQQRIYDKLNN